MKTITCPKCGAPVPIYSAFRSIKAFCGRCGWNLQRAEADAANQSTAAAIVPLVIAAVAIIASFSIGWAKSPWFFLIPLIFAVLMLLPFFQFVSARKALNTAKTTVNPNLALAQPPLDPYLQQLQIVARPRRVRFRFPVAIVIMLLFVVLVGLLAYYFPQYATRPSRNAHGVTITSPFLIVLVFFVILAGVPFVRDRRRLPLMRDGELALGKVTYQENVSQGKSSYSRIGYEFKTSSGQLIQDQAKDLTFSVYEDMTIPVFYDPANPSVNITPCATYLSVSTEPY
jgi:uncharacterized protein (DUF983 family)/uncharacterized membrane protein (DUF485 family)